MLIDATHAEETRVVVVDGNKVDEFDFESLNKRQLAGNIYLAKVTRVEPSLQAAFIDYGGNRHGFLAFSEIHPDYYQIPAADRQAILDEEAAEVARLRAEEDSNEEKPKSRTRRRRKKPAEAASDGAPAAEDAVVTGDLPGTGEQPDLSAPVDASESVDAGLPETDTGSDADATDAAGEIEEVSSPSGVETVAEPETLPVEEVIEEVKAKAPSRKPRARRYKIQEVIKVRQILLVQVVKEERGNKGAALTTYLSLAGRYCVLMPNTARGGGISRKITNVTDRKKLKEIANSINVPQGAGLIIRTAGANRTKSEIKRDYEYLLRQWEQIRELTLKSIAPTHIYEEGSLIKRSIRDLYNKDIDEIIIDGERGYREAKDYMKMLMPSHAKNVKRYTEALPLFSRFQVESYLAGMFNPTVQLKSGGYIVIGITEALVAIDVNSGRATKENSIEDTARKTNLEAAEEVARQVKLRDLAGLIVIDFIDMEDRRNNLAVEKRLKDKLKNDRARIQVGRISGFGLLEMSRQRLRSGMLEASTQPCPHCHGTGITRSNDSMALAILRELEEEGVRQRCKEVLVSVPIEVGNYMLNQKREHVATIESRFGLSVRIEVDQHLISPEYRVERLKTASRIVPEAEILTSISVKYDPVEEEAGESVETGTQAETETDAPSAEKTPKKRRRRRRRGGKGRNGGDRSGDETANDTAEGSPDGEAETPAPDIEASSEKRPRSRVRRRKPADQPPENPLGEPLAPLDADPARVDVPETRIEDAPKPKRKRAPRRRKTADSVVAAAPEPTPESASVANPPADTPVQEAPVEVAPVPEVAAAVVDTPPAPVAEPEPVVDTPEPVAEPAPEPAPEPAKPKRRGWWSRG